MVAFEILVNGKRLYTIGAGDFGVVSADVHWDRIQKKTGQVHERARVMGHALHVADNTHSLWPNEDLKVGDEVTIRIIETDDCDPPASRRTTDELKASLGKRPRDFSGPA